MAIMLSSVNFSFTQAVYILNYKKSAFSYSCPLNGNGCYVPHLGLVPHSGTVCPPKAHGSYGAHLLDHLAADGTGLAGGQVAVVALLEVDADLPWCTPSILKSPFAHVFALQKGGKVPCTMKCETGPTLVYREDTIGVMSRSTGLLRQETLEPEDSPARQ